MHEVLRAVLKTNDRFSHLNFKFVLQVPHNIADFALLVGQGMGTMHALKLQFVTALGTVAGAFCFHDLTFFLTNLNIALNLTQMVIGAWCGSLAIVAFGPWLELFVAGGFL